MWNVLLILPNCVNCTQVGFDALGDVLKPAGQNQTMALNQQQQTITGQTAAAPTATPGKVLTGDLDSSLASLAENLTINKSASAQVK